MTVKEQGMEVIDSMPDETTLDDIIHALYFNAKFRKGQTEISEGKGISHDEAGIRLSKWQR